MEEILKGPAELLAEIAGVDLSTARRWKRRKRLPPPALRLLRIVILGDISPLGFDGWRILRGQLVSPEAWAYTPGEVLALTLLRQRVAHLEAAHRKFLGLSDQAALTEDDPLDILKRLAGD